jgi:hypothetical protein
MTLPEVREKILEDLDQLPPAMQRRALELVHELREKSALPRGATREDLHGLAGTLDAESAREMREAIEEDCEQIDPDGW